MSVSVVRRKLKHYYDGSLKELYYLKQEKGSSRVYTEADLGKEIQETSSLSVGDVTHVLGIVMTEMRKVLVRGDRVHLDGLGIFYMTLSCDGVETEEDCNVRQIKRVNIRFLPDKALKLVNNALAATRSDNNVSFAIKDSAASSSGNGGGNPEPGDGEEDDDFIDPGA